MKRIVKRVAGLAVVAGGAVALRPGTRAHRLATKGVELADRRLRYAGGRLTGVRYRLRGGHPETGADDSVIADRVRSALGPVTKRLDLPHVHVTVEDGTVLLHGVVGRVSEAIEIETATLGVYGVTGVESYLHVGLGASDTRPSEGHDQSSPLMHRLRDATLRAGIAEEDVTNLVRAVLATFGDRLPEGERAHVAAHLPPDVVALLVPPARHGAPARTVATFADRVASSAGNATRDDAVAASVAVLRELHAAVPEEVADVAAVLPAELRMLWPAPAH